MQSVYFYKVDERFAEKLYVSYCTQLSSSRQALIKSYTFKSDRMLCFISELLLRCVACNCLGIRNTDIEIKKNEYGKPYLEKFPEFCFNYAHTDSDVVLAVSRAAIGVDIESKREINPGIVQRFFANDEQKYINNGLKAEHIDRVLETWTKKEAYLKYTGEGLRRPLFSFSVWDPLLFNKFQVFRIFNYILSICGDSVPDGFNTIIVSNEMFIELLQKL